MVERDPIVVPVEEAAKFEEEEDKIGLTANRCNSAYVFDIGVDISI
jgi:hypothetical protein